MEPGTDILLRLEGVSAGFDGNPVISDVNLTIRDLDFMGIIGPNGGGKTTLIRVIMGLLPLMAGRIVFPSGSIKNLTGYLPQVSHTDLGFPITVREVVRSGITRRKMFRPAPGREDMGLIDHVLKRLGVLHLAEQVIGQISGGERQRVFLARAIISSPRLLILDEPNSYVDNAFESELYEILRELNREMTILMVTHDLGIISSYVKSIACVNRQLFYHPSNIITQEQLRFYNCPIKLITHGDVPHTVLKLHENKET
ncbi:MAG: ABC transporter ATP-binding protein [Bacteroidales bacterium]|nr:ABC transporter ATP-binding protein [Bacteroidales bacterium]